MDQSWVSNFYKTQFELTTDHLEWEDELIDAAQEIFEQVGTSFSKALDIGAGVGGLARAMSKLGIHMTTVELEPSLVDFAKTHSPSDINIHCDSFYTIEFDKQFDVVSYTDGFGVGDDGDQLLLLKRIANWMKDDGCALIDIYQPLYWQKAHGQSMRFGQAERKYEYDFQSKRMLDHWWHTEKPNDIITQSLRCYTIDEISSLCQQAGLIITGLFPSGAFDFDEQTYQKCASLNECLSFRIKVKK